MRTAGLIMLLLGGCRVELGLPEAARLSCTVTADCPAHQQCSPVHECSDGDDTLGPGLVSVDVTGETRLVLTFDEPLYDGDASAAARFTIVPSLLVSEARGVGGTQVIELVTSPQAGGVDYVITADVRDTAGNTIRADAQSLPFTGFGLPPDDSPPQPLGPDPTLLQPQGAAELSWTERSGAYTVDVATDALFANIIETETVTDRRLAVSLPEPITYYWRVRADSTAAGAYGSSQVAATDDTVYVSCPDGGDCDGLDAEGAPELLLGNKTLPHQRIQTAIAVAHSLGLHRVAIASRGDDAYPESVVVTGGAVDLVGYGPGFGPVDALHPTRLDSSAPVVEVGTTDSPVRIESLTIESSKGGGSLLLLLESAVTVSHVEVHSIHDLGNSIGISVLRTPAPGPLLEDVDVVFDGGDNELTLIEVTEASVRLDRVHMTLTAAPLGSNIKMTGVKMTGLASPSAPAQFAATDVSVSLTAPFGEATAFSFVNGVAATATGVEVTVIHGNATGFDLQGDTGGVSLEIGGLTMDAPGNGELVGILARPGSDDFETTVDVDGLSMALGTPLTGFNSFVHAVEAWGADVRLAHGTVACRRAGSIDPTKGPCVLFINDDPVDRNLTLDDVDIEADSVGLVESPCARVLASGTTATFDVTGGSCTAVASGVQRAVGYDLGVGVATTMSDTQVTASGDKARALFVVGDATLSSVDAQANATGGESVALLLESAGPATTVSVLGGRYAAVGGASSAGVLTAGPVNVQIDGATITADNTAVAFGVDIGTLAASLDVRHSIIAALPSSATGAGVRVDGSVALHTLVLTNSVVSGSSGSSQSPALLLDHTQATLANDLLLAVGISGNHNSVVIDTVGGLTIVSNTILGTLSGEGTCWNDHGSGSSPLLAVGSLEHDIFLGCSDELYNAPTGTLSMMQDLNDLDGTVNAAGQHVKVSGNVQWSADLNDLMGDPFGPDGDIYELDDDDFCLERLNAPDDYWQQGRDTHLTDCGTSETPASCGGVTDDIAGLARDAPFSIGVCEVN